MNFTELMIRNQYISHGETSIPESLIHKSMPCTEVYRQSINHLDLNTLKTVFNGIVAMARNHASIHLLYCPVFNEEEIIIDEGEDFIDGLKKCIRSRFDNLLSGLQEMDLHILHDIIASHYLQLQLCITKDNGVVYNPVGIMTDHDGYSFVFRGGFSAVSPEQYEVVQVFRSWIQDNLPYVNSEIKAFDLIWNHNHQDLAAYDIIHLLLASVEDAIKTITSGGNKTVIKLRDYQEEAIQAWIDNDYHGFYVMATGTGKTWTAIYSANA